MAWKGRQLTGYAKNGTMSTFSYDADGLRATKTVDGVKTVYQYVGDKLFYEKRGDNIELYYFYDSYGKLSAISYVTNGTATPFYVSTNAQGDVLSIHTGSGVKVAQYDYDAWGNATVMVVTTDADGKYVYTTVTDESAPGHISTLNPIRYRGYYYDEDLELYYLQSRYYDSEIGRFINSDNITDSGAGVLGYNTYLYCGNNPVNSSDPSGHWLIKDAIKQIAQKVSEKVRVWKEKVVDNTGTLQVGTTFSGCLIVQGNFSGAFAFDKRGNVGCSFAAGGGGGSPSVSLCEFFTVTEAPSIIDLNGKSFQIGGSVDFSGISVGAEYTGMMDSYGEIYSGMTTAVGVGFAFPAPGEVHTDITKTKVYSINIFDVIDNVCTRIMEW